MRRRLGRRWWGHEDQQITQARADDRVGNNPTRPAGLRTSLQPQEVHPTPTVRLPGTQRVSQNGLPRRRLHPGGLHRPVRRDRARTNPALHNFAESCKEAKS